MSQETEAKLLALVKLLVDKINDAGPSGLLGLDILILSGQVQQALARVEKENGRGSN